MANWARDYLLANPGVVVGRHRYGLTYDVGDGKRVTHFVGKPAHHFSGGLWLPVDTDLVDNGAFWQGQGTPIRIDKANGNVTLPGQTFGHRSNRVVRWRPSTGATSTVVNLAALSGQVTGAVWKREFPGGRFEITNTEDGARSVVTLDALPSFPGGTRPDDMVGLEEQVTGLEGLPDGPVPEEFSAHGVLFLRPVATDANGTELPITRRLVTNAQGRWLLTLLSVADLQRASYPLVIDPDYSGSTNDGYVTGYDDDWPNQTYTEARTPSGTGTVLFSVNSTTFTVGQIGEDDGKGSGHYAVYRPFLKFNTSAIGTDTVTQVNLKMVSTGDGSSADFDVTIRKADWSGTDPVTSGNKATAYATIGSAAADDNIWRNTSGMATLTQYTSGNLSTAWVNKTGWTYYGLRSSRDVSATEPAIGTFEWIYLASQENATSSYRPVLTVAHSGAAGLPIPVAMAQYRQRWS